MADVLPSELSRVDPADAWKPWRPTAAAPWDKKWVAHLYRRAAFGPSPKDTETALAAGAEKTLDRLMTGEPDAAEMLDLLMDTGKYYTDPVQLRAWWLYAMLESGHPLREKLTLFWHNHFATSLAKVRFAKLMFDQNVILRKHALGKFRPFLLDMSKDTAMLIWLDSNDNVKGRPNENYAREVMELFSLGVGNYTEKDIQEAARAFTGWHHTGAWVVPPPQSALPDELSFQYKPKEHDDGPKTLFGKTGNWGGEDVLRLCADRPSCAKFLVGKLYAFLVSETKPPAELLEPLAERFRTSDYDIADLVRTVLGSRLFFSEHAYRKRVKWPVEYALGAVRGVVPNRVPLGDLIDPLSKMGQALFAPPNVKGWRYGTDWLNSATLLARNNFAEEVALGKWKQTNVRALKNAAFEAVNPPTAVADVAVPDELMFLPNPVPPGGTPETAGKVLVGPPEKVQAAAAAVGASAVYPLTAMAGPGSGPPPVPAAPPGTPQSQAKKGPADGPSEPTDAKWDPIPVLYATKPATVPVLVKRMGEVLYGEPVPPAAKAKIEKFLLAGKKSVDAKGMESPEFKRRAREALHALMCLPEYQLG
jgi:hypothetical protein